MVIWVPSKVCHTRNILTSWVRFSGLLFTFSFHDVRYSKNVPWSQSNLWSSLELYTFKNNFNFFLDSLTLCTSKKSKKSQTFNKLYLFPGNSEFGTALQKKHVILFFQLKLLWKKLTLKKTQVKITSRSKFMPVFVFQCDVIFDKLSKLGQISCVIPYYIEKKDSLNLDKFFANLLENWYKMRKIIT